MSEAAALIQISELDREAIFLRCWALRTMIIITCEDVGLPYMAFKLLISRPIHYKDSNFKTFLFPFP